MPQETGARWRTVWEVILGEWDEVTSNDLHQHFGIDTGLPETMQRPWWWLRSRVLGLLDIPESRLIRRLGQREAQAATDAPDAAAG